MLLSQGFIRLNQLGLSMSPKSINRALDKVGEDFSTKLIQMREQVSDHLQKEGDLKQQRKDLTERVLEQESALKANKDETAHEDLTQDIEQSKVALNNLTEQVAQLAKERPSSYCLVLDNLDIRIEAAEVTSENQNKDHHWCNHNAVFDRVNPVEFSDDKPLADILDLPNRDILPSLEDHKKVLNDFVVLVSRVFVEYFSCFEIFNDVVPNHIKHKYSQEMKKPSNKV